MNTRTLPTCPRSTILAVVTLLSGCVEVHELPELDGGPPTSSRDGGASWPDPVSCTVIDVVAGDTPLDIIGADDTTVEMTYHGSWTHLRHPADVAATLYVETLGGTADGGAFLAMREVATTAELEHRGGFYPGAFSVPLYAPEQDIFLFPTGGSFRVHVCYEVRDPFPTCVASGDGGIPECRSLGAFGENRDTGTWCACAPLCVTAADCPIPSTGDVGPTCEEGGRCLLPCDASSRCPDGQECMTRTDGSSVCMTRF